MTCPMGSAPRADDTATRASFRWRKALRIGTVGAKVDAAVLARLKVTRA